MLRAPPLGHPLQKCTTVQWDMRALLGRGRCRWSAHLGRVLSNAQMSGLGGEAEIFRSITALLVLTKRLWSRSSRA
jgi:hypothetical protein